MMARDHTVGGGSHPLYLFVELDTYRSCPEVLHEKSKEVGLCSPPGQAVEEGADCFVIRGRRNSQRLH